jgi:hypothetical protein
MMVPVLSLIDNTNLIVGLQEAKAQDFIQISMLVVPIRTINYNPLSCLSELCRKLILREMHYFFS